MDRPPDVDPQALDALVRRAFGSAVGLACERTAEGVSAQVYRVRRGDEVFYLRLAEEAGQDLSVDAALHGELRRRGVRIPEIVFVEPLDAGLGRSVLIMTEIPGLPLATLGHGHGAAADAIARAAGRDLARLNQVPVTGFGWIRREPGRVAPPWVAELASHADFVVAHLPSPWPGRLAALLAPAELARLESSLSAERQVARPEGRLAHGDFDALQIFQQDGRYTGIIELGEIRGAEPCFDLGHFVLQQGDGRESGLPPLIEGYREIAALPDGAADAISRSALLLGLRQLCRWIDGPRRLPLDHAAVTARVRRLRELLG